jgi:hypothetical protein
LQDLNAYFDSTQFLTVFVSEDNKKLARVLKEHGLLLNPNTPPFRYCFCTPEIDLIEEVLLRFCENPDRLNPGECTALSHLSVTFGSIEELMVRIKVIDRMIKRQQENINERLENTEIGKKRRLPRPR